MKHALLSAAILIGASLGPSAWGQKLPELTPQELHAKRMFLRLTGAPLMRTDPRLAQMAKLLDDGDDYGAARIAMSDENFLKVTIKRWASTMDNKTETPFVPFDDFQALVIGVVRDGIDARQLLTGDFTYDRQGIVSNPGDFDYEIFDQGGSSYETDLVKVPQKLASGLEPSGVFTTRGWARAHYTAGTNRRSVQYAFQEFLCAPITQWKTPGLDDRFVRRDVDRKPGKNPATYEHQCRSCHAPMDAMAGAFASVDFPVNDGGIGAIARATVHPKYNQNAQVYPDGYVTVDDSWVNLLAENHVQDDFFGWTGPTEGKGIREFGRMLANSAAFKSCMARKAFKSVCRRDPERKDTPAIDAIAQDFAANGYDLKRVFGEAALLPACGSGDDSLATVGIKNFREYVASLEAVTGVKPLSSYEINRYYRTVQARLPKTGLVSELNSTVQMTYAGLAGLYCKAYQSARPGMPAATDADIAAIAEAYSRLFLDRSASDGEIKALTAMAAGIAKRDPAKIELEACTAYGASLEFIPIL